MVAEDERFFSFTFNGENYTVDELTFNAALNLPTDQFVDLPTNGDLIQFFTGIHYQGDIVLSRLNKKNLVQEWNIFFEIIAKVFANSTKSNNTVITTALQIIGFSIANNRRINIGNLLWNVFLTQLKKARKDFDKGRKVCSYYPHFLTLIFNMLPSYQHAPFPNDRIQVSGKPNKKFYTRLDTSRALLHIPMLITPFMSTFINLPVIPIQAPVQPEQALVPLVPVPEQEAPAFEQAEPVPEQIM